MQLFHFGCHLFPFLLVLVAFLPTLVFILFPAHAPIKSDNSFRKSQCSTTATSITTTLLLLLLFNNVVHQWEAAAADRSTQLWNLYMTLATSIGNGSSLRGEWERGLKVLLLLLLIVSRMTVIFIFSSSVIAPGSLSLSVTLRSSSYPTATPSPSPTAFAPGQTWAPATTAAAAGRLPPPSSAPGWSFPFHRGPFPLFSIS